MGTTKRDVKELKAFLKERGLWKKFKRAFKEEEPNEGSLVDYLSKYNVRKSMFISGSIIFSDHEDEEAYHKADEAWKELHG